MPILLLTVPLLIASEISSVLTPDFVTMSRVQQVRTTVATTVTTTAATATTTTTTTTTTTQCRTDGCNANANRDKQCNIRNTK